MSEPARGVCSGLCERPLWKSRKRLNLVKGSTLYIIHINTRVHVIIMCACYYVILFSNVRPNKGHRVALLLMNAIILFAD